MAKMFCPRCGAGDQMSDSYCRICGGYLIDPDAGRSVYGIVLGFLTPEKQASVRFWMDLAATLASVVLLFFLFGYFDGRKARTGESAPSIIYFVYVFLALVAVWQGLNLALSMIQRSRPRRPAGEPTAKPAEIDAMTEKDLYLPPTTLPPDAEMSPSVGEQTTRQLRKEK